MAINPNGTNLEVTGTHDGADFMGVAGVTSLSVGAGQRKQNLINVAANNMKVMSSAVLNVNPFVTTLHSNDTGDNGLTIEGGGTLNVDGEINAAGQLLYTSRRWFIQSSLESWNNIGFWVKSGAEANIKGGEMFVSKGVQFAPGSTVRLTETIIDIHEVDNYGNSTSNEQQIRQSSADLTVNGLTLFRGFFTIITPPLIFNGYRPRQCTQALGFSSSTPDVNIPIRYFDTDGSNEGDVSFWSECQPCLIDPKNGIRLNLRYNGPSHSSGSHGILRIFKKTDITLRDLAGAILSDAFAVKLRDTNSTRRRDHSLSRFNSDPYIGTQDFSYGAELSGSSEELMLLTAMCAVTGATGDSVNTGVFAMDPRIDEAATWEETDPFNAAANPSQTMALTAWAYGQSPTALTVDAAGDLIQVIDAKLLPDPNVTMTKSSIDAEAEQETTAKAYDRLHSFYADSLRAFCSDLGVISDTLAGYDIEPEAGTTAQTLRALIEAWGGVGSMPYSRTGEVLELEALDLTTAAGAAYGCTASALTLRAATFIGDITTTGTVTLEAIAEGRTIRDAANITLTTLPTVLTLDNTVCIVEGTQDVSEWNFENGASLRLSADANITTGGNTGLSIDENGFVLTREDGLITDVAVTNLDASSVKIINDSGNEAVFVAAQTGTYSYSTPIGSTGTWTAVIDRAGYDPVVIPFSADGENKSIYGSLTKITKGDGSASYQGSSNAGVSVILTPATPLLQMNIGNTSATAQQIFDIVEDALETSDGMAFIAAGGGRMNHDSTPTGITLNMGAHIRLNGTDVNSGVGAFVTSADGQVIVTGGGSINFLSATTSAKLGEYQGYISLDPVNGTDSGVYPFGTPVNPVKTLENCESLKNEFGLTRVFIRNSVTAATGATGLTFFGNNVYPFDLNNKPFTHCKFERVNVHGVDADTTLDDEFVECLIDSDLTGRGYFNKCVFDGDGTTIKLTGSPSDFIDCISRISGTGSVHIDNVSGLDFSVRNWKGGLRIKNMTAGGVSFGSSEGRLTVDSTCGGTAAFIVRGATRLINESSINIDTHDKISVRDELLADELETEAQADARQALLIAEHNATQASLAAIPTTAAPTANDIYAEFTSGSNEDAFKADVSELSTFNPATDTVANVQAVAVNADMRGTDGANTTAPDNAGITANGAAISGLNDLSQADSQTAAASALAAYKAAKKKDIIPPVI